MKNTIFLLSLICISSTLFSQPLPDSVLTKYKSAKTDEEKGVCINNYLDSKDVDSAVFSITLNLLAWFKKLNDEVGVDYTGIQLSYILVSKSDFAAALNILFPILERFEKRQDNFGISNSYRAISNVYFLSKNYEQAAEYTKKTIPLLPETNRKEKLSRIYNGIACIYGEGGLPDSGMVYAQEAVKMDTEMKNYQQLALSISTLGENYIAAKEYDIALPFLRKSLDYYNSKKAIPLKYLYSYLMNDFAQVFLEIKQYDSAYYYSNQALLLSIPNEFKDQSLRSYEYLYNYFEITNKEDSVNKYFRLAMSIKDSLYNLEKIKSVQALSFREELRQQELAIEKTKAETERRENMQFALIALGIFTFISLFLILSRSYITNTKVIEYLGIIALLLVFEFLNLLLHPLLESITHHSPVFMLVALVCIAALLVPLHHRVEKWATHKLVEKNKAIRLAEAKRTIEKLGDKLQG